MSPELNHKEFEEYYDTTNFENYSVWKPELNRYTLFSMKQYAWEIWNAARGIPYTYDHGYK